MKVIIGKVVILGHQGVGKTSTVIRFIENTFNKTTVQTVGASFFTSKIYIDNACVKLQIWDTAGQERFKAMAPMFYRNANAAVLIFDITSYDTFEKLKIWVMELRRNVEYPMILCVVGNKIDLIKDRKVSRDDAIKYSKSIGASYLECSALDDQGVGIVFENIARDIIRLSGEQNCNNLKIYDNIEDIMADSSELEATDVGNEENVNLSVSSIAHGKSVGFRCC